MYTKLAGHLGLGSSVAMSLLQQALSAPNVLTITQGNTTIYACGVLPGARLVSGQMEEQCLHQIGSLVAAAQPHTLLLDTCVERISDAQLEASRRDPAQLAASIADGSTSAWLVPFWVAVHDSLVSKGDALRRQLEFQRSRQHPVDKGGMEAGAGGGPTLWSSLGLPSDITSVASDKLISATSAMLSTIARIALPEPGAATTVGRPVGTAVRIVRGARPWSVTLARLQHRDVGRALAWGLAALAHAALRPLLNVWAQWVDNVESPPKSLEAWALSRLPITVDDHLRAILGPAVHQLWWKERLSDEELTRLKQQLKTYLGAQAANHASPMQWLWFVLGQCHVILDELNAIIPSLLLEEDQCLAVALAALCAPPGSASAPTVVVAVVPAWRLPGMRTQLTRACAGEIDIAALTDPVAAGNGLQLPWGSLPLLPLPGPDWLRSIATAGALIGGVVVARSILVRLLPRVLVTGIWPALSLVSSGAFCYGGTQAQACTINL